MYYVITAIIIASLGLGCTYILMMETAKFKRQSMRYQKALKKQEDNR